MSQDDTYLRDIIAAFVLNGIVPMTKNIKDPDWEEISQKSYKIADVMMKVRKNESIS